MRRIGSVLLLLMAGPAMAGYRVAGVSAVSVGPLAEKGQAADPQWSPDGRMLSFEFLGADGDTLEVYLSELSAAYPPRSSTPIPVMPKRAKDPFALKGAQRETVSEYLAWGPPKGKGYRYALAATREAVERGAPQVSFDVFMVEPGRKRFLTASRANDDHPAFSPDGEFLAFVSGASGQGDLYLYQFYADADPLVQLTFEAGGPELYPVWAPTGSRLAYTGHLGSADHIYVIDEVDRIASEHDVGRRKSLARKLTRDLTPGWKASCLAPSFSPDGKWIAFYARTSVDSPADLYVVPTAGGTARRVFAGGLPETRRGPRWGPGSDGFFAVSENAARMNPLVWIPLEGGGARELSTGTQLNADPYPRRVGDSLYLLFTAQGASEGIQKRWRKPYVARLIPDRAD